MAHKEREAAILEFLQTHGEATVSELCRSLFVSEATMRRDLAVLNLSGRILRTHGGAVFRSEPCANLPQTVREREHAGAKAVIAKRCLSLINDGDTVMVDASSTALELLKLIGEKHSVVVVTNSAKAALVLAETKVKTFVSGGELAGNSYAYVGSYTEEFFRGFNADVCFFSVRTLTPDGRLTDNAIAENAVRRVMLSRAKKRVLMLDSEKLAEPCMHTLCELEALTHIVSEKDLSDAYPSHRKKFI